MDGCDAIFECPCCGCKEYDIPQTSEDDAIIACPFCTVNLVGVPHYCSKAQAIHDRRKELEK